MTLGYNWKDRLDTAEKFYALGWFASDGSLSPRSHCIVFQLQYQDADVLEILKTLFNAENPVKIIKQAGKKIICGKVCRIQDAVRLELHSKYFDLRLQQLGFSNQKSRDLTFPSWITDDHFASFCRGYWEGDGSFILSNGNASVSIAGTFAFCSGLLGKLSQRLSISCRLNKIKNTSVINISGSTQCCKFFDFIYPEGCLKMKRKFQKASEWLSALKRNPRIHQSTRDVLPAWVA